jgi:hypothetical protein
VALWSNPLFLFLIMENFQAFGTHAVSPTANSSDLRQNSKNYGIRLTSFSFSRNYRLWKALTMLLIDSNN